MERRKPKKTARSFMKIKKLFQDIPGILIKGAKDAKINGICADSRLIAPGNLFVAKKGRSHNGNRFILQAIAGGAVAVLTDIYNPFIKDTVQIIHSDVESIESFLAARYFDFPSKKLFTIGVTGTNGKTTCAYLIKHIFDSLEEKCGLIGSIEYIIGSLHYPSTRTTPDVISNNRMLKDMIKNSCKSAVMEVSSHALDQNRVKDLTYDIAVFTNLSRDHLDYHQNMESYCTAKSKLLSFLGKKDLKQQSPILTPSAVLNADSEWTPNLLKDYKGDVLTYGINRESDIRASKIFLNEGNAHFDVCFKGEKTPFSWPLIGRFNIYNCLAAIACGLIKGARMEELAEIIENFNIVPGRLEKVPNKLDIHIYVDYAHTENAMQNVLESLQEIKKNRIITIFGCGGDRDKGKRPKMGKVAENFSDLSIITSDNPRTENPEDICSDILKGFKNPSSPFIELDRKQAIEKAIDLAQEDDIVLIAGKGHEKYQVFSRQTISFDDSKIASEICIQKYKKMCTM